MKKFSGLAVGAALIAGLVSFSFAPALAQQTAKACEEQWKSGKASIQAAGKKKRDFIAECRGASPAAAVPATTAPTSTSSSTSAKTCEEQWKANKPSIQASGKTKKVFVSECRTGSTTTSDLPAKRAPTAAAPSSESKAPAGSMIAVTPAKPTTTGAAPSSESKTPAGSTTAVTPAKPATTAAAPSSESKTTAKPTTVPTTAGTPAAANQYSIESAAKLRCPQDTVVWVNLNSAIYHFNGKNDYGTTKRGAYMCEKDTGAAGFRAAKNEKRP